MAVGEGVAEAGVGLHEVVVEIPLFHPVFLIVGIPEIFDSVDLPLISCVGICVTVQAIADHVFTVFLWTVVVAVVYPSG